MPLYEYECDACGHRFEVIQKFSDAPVDKCPSCGGTVHKLQSAPAIQFKGSGFYITDYAKKDYTAATKADTAPAEGGAAKGAKDDAKETAKSATSEKSTTPAKSSATGDSTPSGSSSTSSAPSTSKDA